MNENTNNVWTNAWTTTGDAAKSTAESLNKAAAKTVEATVLSADLTAHGAFITADATCIGLTRIKAWAPKDGTEAIDRTSEFVSEFFDDVSDTIVDIADAAQA